MGSMTCVGSAGARMPGFLSDAAGVENTGDDHPEQQSQARHGKKYIFQLFNMHLAVDPDINAIGTRSPVIYHDYYNGTRVIMSNDCWTTSWSEIMKPDTDHGAPDQTRTTSAGPSADPSDWLRLNRAFINSPSALAPLLKQYGAADAIWSALAQPEHRRQGTRLMRALSSADDRRCATGHGLAGGAGPSSADVGR